MDFGTEPVALGPGLPVSLDRADGQPLHDQLEAALRASVRSGRLPPGSKLPSSRALAAELGLSRGVVLEAYSQLSAEGYLVARQGSATRVAQTAAAERSPLPAAALESRYAIEFDPGLPDLSAFPRQPWLRAVRSALRDMPFAGFGAGDPRGAPALRNELMSYLGRVRAAAPEPEHTLVTTGFSSGLACLCRTLAARGVEQIAVEDPGWARHRLIAQATGLEAVPVEVDEDGVDVGALAASGCEVVVLTPAHQFPTGVVLSPERRGALLEWAEERDGLIVEDDYDSELRYDRGGIGALQGLAPERVCSLGSLAARLAPGLRLGWMLAPSWLSGALTYEQGSTGAMPPILEQLALAEFLRNGDLDRHLRRMRLRYRERRAVLLEALERRLPEAEVGGAAAGLFILAALPGRLVEASILAAAGSRGVGLEGLSTHRAAAEGPPGLVLGFANLSQAAIERGIAAVEEAVQATAM